MVAMITAATAAVASSSRASAPAQARDRPEAFPRAAEETTNSRRVPVNRRLALGGTTVGVLSAGALGAWAPNVYAMTDAEALDAYRQIPMVKAMREADEFLSPQRSYDETVTTRVVVGKGKKAPAVGEGGIEGDAVIRKVGGSRTGYFAAGAALVGSFLVTQGAQGAAALHSLRATRPAPAPHCYVLLLVAVKPVARA